MGARTASTNVHGIPPQRDGKRKKCCRRRREGQVGKGLAGEGRTGRE